MEQGDGTWHHGWTVHSAGPQPPTSPARIALTVSFIADGARVLKKRWELSMGMIAVRTQKGLGQLSRCCTVLVLKFCSDFAWLSSSPPILPSELAAPLFRDPSVHRHMLHNEDAESYEGWIKDIKDGGKAVHDLLPVVYGPGMVSLSAG